MDNFDINPPNSTEQYGTTFGKPEYDYITVTTFEQRAFWELYNALDVEGEGTSDHFRGYSGTRHGPFRFLEGDQLGKWHGIVIAEGNASRHVISTLSDVTCSCHDIQLRAHFRCTRLDIQVSTPDNFTHFRTLKDAIANPFSPWNKRGKPPSVSLIEGKKSKRGLGSTLYVGSSKTKNGYFVRMYEKEHLGIRHLRFEVQLKGKVAEKQYNNITERGTLFSCARVVRTVFNTFPIDVQQGHLNHIDKAIDCDHGTVLRNKHVPSDDVKRCMWFKYDVARAITNIESDASIEFMRRELVKCFLVLGNKQRRRKLLEEREEMYEVLDDAAASRLDAQLMQIDTMESLIEETFTDTDGSRDKGVLPEQLPLFDAETSAEMIDALYWTPFNEYR